MLVHLILAACSAGPSDPASGLHPSTGDDTAASGDDSGTSDPLDRDGDGWRESDGDCDDGNAAVFPTAYDRPNDGVDGDCSDGDRTCDCLVLDAASVSGATFEAFDTQAPRTLDVAYLLDTTSSGYMVREFGGSFPDIVAEFEDDMVSVTFGVAAFDDYAYDGMGESGDGDRPFNLHHQQTDDFDGVEGAVRGLEIHNGGDGPESAMEGLFQALEGGGYDQDCDGGYDSSADVRPFVADSADPFGGGAGQFYDSTDESTGTIGGMGFREEAHLRVLVYATDGYMRDPDSGYPAPGGCPGDAGLSDVAASAIDRNVYLVGVANSDNPLTQMDDVAAATGSVADVDGDGEVDDELVFRVGVVEGDIRDAILDAVHAISAANGLLDVYASVSLEVREDPLGIVSSVSPSSYDDVAWADVDALAFDVSYDTSAYGAKAVVGSVELALVGDGFDLQTVVVDVEIAPL
jgi:hypothetical protein